MRRRNRLLIALPLLMVVLIVTALIAIPSFVSSRAHRTTIEKLASALTGRDVHIGGHLSLALFPAPQLIAERITITGPADETITAKSLLLDIAVPALLQGRLSARSLTLQSPVITIPWPLPQGLSGLSPPAWLTALHGQIVNGSISIGQLRLSQVSADLFTGPDGAFSISGNAAYANEPLTLSLSLGAKTASGQTPLTFDAASNDALKLQAHLSATINSKTAITGKLSGAVSLAGTAKPTNFSAAITAGTDHVTAKSLTLQTGNQVLTGDAAVDFASAKITAALSGQQLDLSPAAAILRGAAGFPLAVNLKLDATASSFRGYPITQLQMQAQIDAAGVNLPAFTLQLPGKTSLTGKIDRTTSGQITGQASLRTADLPGLLSAYGIAAKLPDSWGSTQLTASLQGDSSHLALLPVQGSIGPGAISGSVTINWPGSPAMASGIAAFGQLHISQLDLSPLPALAGLAAAATQHGINFSAGGEITLDKASFNGVTLTNLLLDGAIAPNLADGKTAQINIRRLSATVFGGLAAASFTLDRGQIRIARVMLALPSAAPLQALLPANWQRLPASLAQKRLAVSMLAAGPFNAVASSAAASLGDLTLTAAPVVNLPQLSAAGPVTLRFPNAIAAFAAFGADAGLGWPGPGSISLRADFAASPTSLGLPDFVLSLGNLTANGKIMLAGGKITGDIDADTLALPPWPVDLALPWGALMAETGTIKLSADQVLLGGAPVLGGSAASLVLAPNLATLNLANASLANGTLSGSFTAATAAKTPPDFTTKFKFSGLDAGAIHLPPGFPYTIPAGRLAGQAVLTASGTSPAAWASSLAGNAALNASKGSLAGFNLAGLGAAALKSPKSSTALRKAAASGASDFSSLTVSGNFTKGVYNLGPTSLFSPAGNATATGSISLPGNSLALNLSLLPKLTPPLTIGLTATGSWSNPKKIPNLKAALSWHPPAPTSQQK
jgi:hypothetical protein